MKSSFFKSLFLAALALFWTTAPVVSLDARADAATVTAVADTVDPYGDVADKVSDTAEALSDALEKMSNDPKTLDGIMKALDKVGLNGTVGEKLGKLSKIKGVGKALSKVISALKIGATGLTLAEAYQKGDKEGFKKAVADALTELAGTAISAAVTAAITAAGTAITGASLVSGPGAVVVGGVCLVGGWILSDMASDAVKDLINDSSVRTAFEDVGEALWDAMNGDGGKGGNGGKGGGNGGSSGGDSSDPFDSDPQGGGGESGSPGKGTYQGLKPLKLIN